MDSGQAERLIKVLTQIKDKMPVAVGNRGDLWMSIRNGLEIQLMNAEDVPASLLDGARLDRMADGIVGKIHMDGGKS